MEKLILVHYINVEGLNIEQGKKVISEYEIKFSNLRDKNIINLFYPIFNSDTKVSCMNPNCFSTQFKMILIHRINVAGLSKDNAEKLISEYETNLSNLDENVINICYPIFNSDTKVECIYPTSISYEYFKQYLEKL